MASKKTFKENISPAMQFISEAATEPTEQGANPSASAVSIEGGGFSSVPPPIGAAIGKPPEGYKLNPLYIETKNKRVQLLMKPSIYAKIKTMADSENRSVNDMIHLILEEFTRGEP
jgi:hypothetical protein